MTRDWRLPVAIVCIVVSSAAYIKLFDLILWRLGLMVIAKECPGIGKMNAFTVCGQTTAETVWGYVALLSSTLAILILGWAFFRPKI